MGDKSERKKSYIIEKARDVFARKGFLTVTMKDLVEACEISRGGLYLYFADTEQIFLEVLKKEREQGGEEEIEKADTAVEMISLILREQKKEILGLEGSLIVPLYEYYFFLRKKDGASENGAAYELPEKERFEMSVKVMEKLIRGGIKEGYLDVEDPLAEAYNMMFAIEGLKIASATIGISKEQVAQEINYLYSHLFVRDEQFDYGSGSLFDEGDFTDEGEGATEYDSRLSDDGFDDDDFSGSYSEEDMELGEYLEEEPKYW